MPEFDIDSLKKTWQEQEVPPKYGSSEILEMLNKNSRNYVKYILWISVAEFLIFLAITVYYVYFGDDSSSLANILTRLGIQKTEKVEGDISHLYFVMKIVSLLITGFFVVKFYQNYRKINVEANLKKFIMQIFRFKKTVNAFILSNILLLICFTAALTAFVLMNLKQQQIHLNNPTLVGFIAGIVVATVLSVLLIWIYYRVVYGIIMRRLTKNLRQLEEIESEVN